MVKYIIFDFDGTLADSKDVIISVYNQLAEKYKFKKMEKEDVEHIRSLSIKERAKYLKFPLYMLPLCAAESYALYKHSIKEVDLFDGIKEMLDGLNNGGYEIAIISSNSEHIIRDFCHKNGIDYIQHILCSNNIFGKDKIIRRFLKTHSLKPSDVIYVGDEQRDIAACKKCGVKVIWVEWGLDVAHTVRHDNPDYTANKPGDILEIVKSV